MSLRLLRIQPLSDALGDLYKEFNALKESLAELTTNFEEVEGFVDDVRLGRKPTAPRGEARPPRAKAEEAEVTGRPRGTGRKTRVIIRKVMRP